MKISLAPLLLIVALAVAACATSGLAARASAENERLAAQGLPFRWTVENTGDGEVMVMHMSPLPVAPTRADVQVSGEILEAIRRREQSKGRAYTSIKEVRQMTDGREVWILQSLREGIAYVVTLGGASQGVTRVGVLGPYTFSP